MGFEHGTVVKDRTVRKKAETAKETTIVFMCGFAFLENANGNFLVSKL